MEKLTNKQIIEHIANYQASTEYQRCRRYRDYYTCKNTKLINTVKDRTNRSITPNEAMPSAYFKTIVDTMAGYLFSNIQLADTDIDTDSDYYVALKDTFKLNDSDIKDMIAGTNSLIYNKAIELVYTVGDGENTPQVKIAWLDPLQVVLVKTEEIEPEIFCAIWFRDNSDGEMLIDVIYADLWESYNHSKSGMRIVESKELVFEKCPVIEYKAELIYNESPFHQIISYIDGLDALLSGNQNDVDKLADAILLLSQKLDDEDKKNLGDIKVIDQLSKDERAEYLEKNMSPVFREYVSKLLIQEIHKHSHVIDWYSPDTGITGEVSGKAMRTRLFDMDMRSKSIERIFNLGLRRRIDLVTEMLMIINTGLQPEEIDIIMNRTLPSEFLDVAPVLNKITFIDDQTKLEMLGLDVQKVTERLTEQKENNMQMFGAGLIDPTEEEETE